MRFLEFNATTLFVAVKIFRTSIRYPDKKTHRNKKKMHARGANFILSFCSPIM